MEPFFATYLTDRHVTFLVVFWATACLLTAALIFFVYTYYKRASKIRKEQRKVAFQREIDEAIFAYLFGMISLDACVQNLRNTGHLSNPLFQKVALKSIISLQKSYGHEQRQALQELYVAAGLSAYSLRKIASGRWVKIAEGIRDLSAFQVMEALPIIEQQLNHRNSVVRNEAMLGLIKLRGLDCLSPSYFKEQPDDWMQANIIHLTKTYKLGAPGHLEQLLNSTDTSWQLMGIRLIDHFQDTRFIPQIKELALAGAPRLADKSEKVYERLVEFSKANT